MAIVALILLVALLIPIMAILMDSPVGRALARRLEGPGAPDLRETNVLAKKLELLEAEVDDLSRAVDQLREENEFLQRLIQDAPDRPILPPPTKS